MHLEFRTSNPKTEKEIRSFLSHWTQNESFSVKTSGSTGERKSIRIEKEFAEASARKTLDFLKLKNGDKALLCLSADTIAGKMMIIRALIGDLKLIVTDPSSNPLEVVKDEENIDFAAMVPLQVSKSIEDNLSKLRGIKNLIIGGAPISGSLKDKIITEEISAYQTFGMTETISHVAMRKIGKDNSPFIAMPNTLFSAGRDSNLIVDSPDIGVHQLETNDIVELLNEHEFRWIGRKDRIINSGGIKLSPEEIESKIIADHEFFFDALPDEHLGQKLILCVLGGDFDFNLFKALSKYEKPKEIYYFNEFIYTPSDKIDRIKTKKQISHARKQVL